MAEPGDAPKAPKGPEPPKKRKVKIPGYHVESVLGRGAQGTVVKARRERDGLIVAVKLLSPAMAKVSEYRQRFRREATVAMEIQHPHIVAGLEVGQAEGLPFVVMEFVDGETFGDQVARAPADERTALGVARQVASALQCAHERRLVHRDIKPENIMIAKDGAAKLMDLGLAKEIGGAGEELTMTGSVFGTLGYISPEGAVDSKDTDIRSDIYSLGATLYRAVVGEVPFPGKTLTQSLRRALTEDPTPPRTRVPALSAAFDALVLKMLARDRKQRPQDPAELAADIERVARGEMPKPSAGGKASGRAGARPWWRRLWPF